MPYLFRQRYRFERLLGRGGMGAVFLAMDTQARDTGTPGAFRAVKVVSEVGDPQQIELTREMFKKEGAAVGILRSSEHFVAWKGGDDESPAYLAMEYVAWPTLERFLTEPRCLSPRDVGVLGAAILRPLRSMHGLRIVHCDLKPSNLFVLREGETFRIKIADFGVWTFSRDADLSTVMFGPGAVFGSPPYMSPEQVRGEPVDPRSDLFSVGCILWRAATGQPPFPCDADWQRTRVSLIEQGLTRPDAMPEALFVILAKALAGRPQDRHESAQTFASALEVFAGTWDGERVHALARARGTLVALRREVDIALDELEAVVTHAERLRQTREELVALLQETDSESPPLAETVEQRVKVLATGVTRPKDRAHQEDVKVVLPPARPRWTIGLLGAALGFAVGAFGANVMRRGRTQDAVAAIRREEVPPTAVSSDAQARRNEDARVQNVDADADVVDADAAVEAAEDVVNEDTSPEVSVGDDLWERCAGRWRGGDETCSYRVDIFAIRVGNCGVYADYCESQTPPRTSARLVGCTIQDGNLTARFPNPMGSSGSDGYVSCNGTRVTLRGYSGGRLTSHEVLDASAPAAR